MDYRLAFFCLLSFCLGWFLPVHVYIGPDEEKYKEADFGILTKGGGE